MAETQVTEKKPNKFNEIFSTANRFLGPARAKNPFVKNAKDSEVPVDENSSAHNASTAAHPA